MEPHDFKRFLHLHGEMHLIDHGRVLVTCTQFLEREIVSSNGHVVVQVVHLRALLIHHLLGGWVLRQSVDRVGREPGLPKN